MNQFIVFEGVDASGKSTTAKRVAKENGSVYLKTPGDQYKPIREFIDTQAPPLARFHFYLSSVVDASHKITSLVDAQPVICDRYIWSTLVPHAAYYGEDLGKLERMHKSTIDGLVKPQHTVFLEVDEDEQLRRLCIERESLSASDQFCLEADKRKRVRTLYQEVADRYGWLRINTTNRPIESVIEEINAKCFGKVREVAA